MLICSFSSPLHSTSNQPSILYIIHPNSSHAHPYDDDNQRRRLRLFLSLSYYFFLYSTTLLNQSSSQPSSSAQTHIQQQSNYYRKYNQQSIGCTLESSIREILTKVHFTKNSEKILVRVYPTLPIKCSVLEIHSPHIHTTQNLMLRSVFPFQMTIKFSNTLHSTLNLTYLKTLRRVAPSRWMFSVQSLVVFKNHQLDGAISPSKVVNHFEDVLVN